MILGGLMKTTLLDFPEHIACTVFAKGCNLRCPFCHNASLVISRESHGDTLSEGDFFSFLEKRRSILDGVVVSGGEPLLQDDIFEFLKKIREYGYQIKLDTNGTFPDKLTRIIEADLVDYVAMDIKNSPDKYFLTTGAEVLSQVSRSVEILMNSGIEYEFRTTTVEQLHNADDIIAIGKWISGAKRYFIQRFENSGDILGKADFSAPSDDSLREFLLSVKTYVPSAELRGI